ncbi:MAG TPA: hypothetical protein VIO95_10010 [Mycobacterium sp.]
MARSSLRIVVLLIVTVALSVWVYGKSLGGQVVPIESAATAPPSASDPQMRVKLRAWLTDSEPMIDALVIARSNIGTAAGRRDIAGTGAACQTAIVAVADLHRKMPSPDPMLNSQFLQAISDYGAGFPYCLSGSGMQLAASYITAADAAMRAAFDILWRVPGCEPGQTGVLIV